MLATAFARGMGLGLSIDDTLTKPRRDKKTWCIACIQHTPFLSHGNERMNEKKNGRRTSER